MKPSPMTRVVFTYKNVLNQIERVETSYDRFKIYAIALLEDEMVDLVEDIHYTIGDGEKIKLCYYNTEL